MITIIAAIAENGAIGNKGELVYHISADLKRFKALTTGHTVLMGRKTFQSLPKGALPDRRNIVLSRNADIEFPGAERFSSIEEALASCTENEHVFVIGGAEIYRQALPLADRLELTRIYAIPECADAFFPEINEDEWNMVASETFEPDGKNLLRYSFVTLHRKR